MGPGGVYMTHTAQGCTGEYCLDSCSGLEMELPAVDNFKYRYYCAPGGGGALIHQGTCRYYFSGPLSDLYSLPTDPKPATTDYPFAMVALAHVYPTYRTMRRTWLHCT